MTITTHDVDYKKLEKALNLYDEYLNTSDEDLNEKNAVFYLFWNQASSIFKDDFRNTSLPSLIYQTPDYFRTVSNLVDAIEILGYNARVSMED